MDTRLRDDATEMSHASATPARWTAGPWIAAGLILLLATVWRLVGITTTHAWRDEAVTLLHLHATWWDLITRLPWIEDSPPLYFLVLKAWSLAFPSEPALRLPALIFGVAAVAALMKVAQMIRPGSWWTVGLLAALSPIPIHYSQEIRVYTLLMLSVVLCLWAAELIVRDPRSRGAHLMWALCAVLAAHCHAIGMFIFPMTGAYLLVRLWPRWRAALSPWSSVTWLVGCLPMIWFNLHWAHVHKTTGWWIDPVSVNTGPDLVYNFTGVVHFTRTMLRALDTSLIDILIQAGTVVILGVTGLLILAAFCRSRTRRPAIALLAATGMFALMMLATSLRGVPNMIDRTMLPGWVPILLLMGLGAAPGDWRLLGDRILVGLTAIMLALVAGGWVWMAAQPDEERRAAHVECFRWIADRVGPDDLIVITPSWLEDSTAYYLTDVAAERFFTTDLPAYAGRPPRHTLNNHRITVTGQEIKEGPWSQRIRDAIGDRRGQDYSVWLICGYWQEQFGDPVIAQLRGFFDQEFEFVEEYTPTKITGITARRYVPTAFAARYAASAASRPD